MQQAHHRVLVVKGTGLHDGAHQDLDQAAADGVNHHADQDADEGVPEQVRNKGQACQAQAGGNLRHDDTAPVADGVHKLRAEHVHQQLGQEERRGDQGNLAQRDRVVRMQLQEQKRRKIGGNRLGDKAQVARQQGLPVILFHAYSSSSFFHRVSLFSQRV